METKNPFLSKKTAGKIMAGNTAEGTWVNIFLVVLLNDFGLTKATMEYLVKKVTKPAIEIQSQIIVTPS